MKAASCDTVRSELKSLDRTLEHLDGLGCVLGLLSEVSSTVSPDALAALGDAIETLVARAKRSSLAANSAAREVHA